MFSALADPKRRTVVELLRAQPRRAGELAAALDTTPAGLSRHLRVLRESGLIAEDAHPDDARVRLYRLERERFATLRTWVEDVEAFWDDQLAAFKAHAEATRGRPGSAEASATEPRPEANAGASAHATRSRGPSREPTGGRRRRMRRRTS